MEIQIIILTMDFLLSQVNKETLQKPGTVPVGADSTIVGFVFPSIAFMLSWLIFSDLRTFNIVRTWDLGKNFWTRESISTSCAKNAGDNLKI